MTTRETTDTHETDDLLKVKLALTKYGQLVAEPTGFAFEHVNWSGLHIKPDSPGFHEMRAGARRMQRRAEEWDVPRRIKLQMAWVWALPEPLREALLDVISDAVRGIEGNHKTLLSDMLYSTVGEAVGRHDDQPFTEDEMERGLRSTMTLAEVLIMVSTELGMQVPDWLNEKDAAILWRVYEELFPPDEAA